MQHDTRFSAHEKTIDPAAVDGGGRLETYYANVFFIEELRPDPAHPCRDIANKFSFRRAFAGLHSWSLVGGRKRKTETR